MSFAVIDLSQLPPPNVVESLDYEQILAEILAEFQQRYPAFSAPLESDPAYKLLEVSAYREMLVRARVNDSVRAVMLPYATGTDLDNLGAYWNVQRLVMIPADDSTIPPTPAVMELDDNYRRRIQLSMEGQTNAGTEGAYIFQTLSADGRVKDAKPKRRADASILNTVLSSEGDGTPSAELLKAVKAHLMQSDVRQMTDDLIIQGATITTYRVRADIYVQTGPGSEQVMAAARQAVQTVVSERHRLGMIVPVSAVYGALQQPGVSRVVLHEPSADLTPTDEQAAYCSAIELTQVAG
ncbi:baseplate assembly protein [Endozoicomonas acroporae]|uniref:baseplate assembly protein n=1 Tax=Endozoicomonas acroporae TaxID=1701104 RepID=UPI0013D1D9A9|nr:baseplate J/gp47 family protein [Endozoicomonas acroporae]